MLNTKTKRKRGHKNMSVSDKIKAGLKLEGKKIEELAEMLNISRQSMSNKFYRNSFSAEDLIKIADFLGYSLAFVGNNQNITFSMDDIKEKKDDKQTD